MKKYYFIIAALFAIAAVSCQKEIAAPEDPSEEGQATVDPVNPGSGKTVVFTATLPENPVTRTIIGDPDGSGDYTPLWTDSDVIIVNGVASTNTEVLSGGTSARFTVEGVEAPYVVLAPGTKLGNLTYNGEDKTCRFLVAGAGSPQNYTLNGSSPTYDPRHAVIGAYGTTEDLTFHHLCVYYKITVDAINSTDSDNIRYIYIRQGDGSLLAGYWTATYTPSGISLGSPSPSSAVTLDCGEGGIAHGTPMIVAVPAYDYANGLYITLKDVNGHFATYKMKSTATQFASAAGTVLEFEPEFSPAAGTISSADDWNDFAAAYNSGDDFDLYRWIGNGTVKLGASFSATDLTRVTNFRGTFDGQGYTITRTAATTNLFAHIYGSVSNLTLAGNLNASSQTAPLAFDLKEGGSISGCTNNMAISFDGASSGYVGGLVCLMAGGSITGCSNAGTIDVVVDNSAANHNIAVGGIVSYIDQTDADVTLTDCTNSGAITVSPVSAADNSYGAIVNGVGGIAGWLKGATYKHTFNNCDNSAPITISADNIDDANTVGFKKYACSLGGIVGIGSPISTSLGALNTPSTTNGLEVSFYDCDNSGLLTNDYAISSDGSGNNMKIYTGGIAGSLLGKEADYIELDNCRNTGNILTYNLTGSGAATTPGLTQVAGGLVGYGGYLDICNGSWVVCTIGDRKRPAFAYAGLIGLCLRPFTVDDATVWITLNKVRLAGANCNTATVAVLPYRFRKNDGTYITLSPAPAPAYDGDFSDYSITNSSIGGNLYYTDLAVGSYDNTADQSGSSSTLSLKANREIRGNASTNITSTPSSVVRTGNTQLDSDPTP